MVLVWMFALFASAAAPTPEAVPAPLPELAAEPLSDLAAEPAPQTLEEVWASLPPEDVLSDAIARRGVGDFSGADERLAFLQAHAPSVQVDYHAALSLEFQERTADALAAYSRIVERWPDTPQARDAAFRRALCLEDLGRHAESLDQVRLLQREGSWDAHDRALITLERGISELRGGRVRRGRRRITRELAMWSGTDDLSWMRARAHAALAHQLVEESREVRLRRHDMARYLLRDGGGRLPRSMRARARLLTAAEAEIIAVTHLKEPEWVLDGLLLLGDAYVSLRDDLVAVSPPAGLAAVDQERFLAQRAVHARILERKAWRFYDEGVNVAVRAHWAGRITEVLRARRDAIDLGSGHSS